MLQVGFTIHAALTVVTNPASLPRFLLRRHAILAGVGCGFWCSLNPKPILPILAWVDHALPLVAFEPVDAAMAGQRRFRSHTSPKKDEKPRFASVG